MVDGGAGSLRSANVASSFRFFSTPFPESITTHRSSTARARLARSTVSKTRNTNDMFKGM